MEPREVAQRQLHILTAVVDAIEHRDAVLQALWNADTQAAGREAVRELLGCDDMGAAAVMDMQWRRLTCDNRQGLIERVARLRAEVDSA